MISWCQEALFKNIMCNPIQFQIERESFYDTIQLFYPLVSFGYMATKLTRLKPVVKLALSEQNRVLFDPKLIKFYQQPASLYLKFFTAISVLLKACPNSRKIFQEEIIQLVDLIDEQELFQEPETDSDDSAIIVQQHYSLNIYYFMLVSFSVSIFGESGFEPSLVNKLIRKWFKTTGQKLGDKNVMASFGICLNLLTVNYPKILSNYVDKLWDL